MSSSCLFLLMRCAWFVGGSPTASYFSCLAKKSNQKKSPPVCRAFGVPCVARLVRRLRNSPYGLRQSSPTTPDQPPLLGGAQGRGIKSPNSKPSTKKQMPRLRGICFLHIYSLSSLIKFTSEHRLHLFLTYQLQIILSCSISSLLLWY
jgi:hypothetical protein